ncbi:MAG: thiamine-phosphate kinase [Phycisphaerales bacterium]|nr:MAG: thiamine-phosphate kinase [Phycisphaerales bacterium]
MTTPPASASPDTRPGTPRDTPGDTPGENRLLEHIEQRTRALFATRPDVPVGPGDDCAVIRTPAGDDLLITVDQLVAGVHFDPATTSPDQIARKAVARSVSDIAAMGGSCWLATATALLPQGYADAQELFDRVHAHAEAFGCPVVGGDIASGPSSPLTLTVTVLGRPHPARGVVRRSGAKPGDRVYVTGRLGGSLASGRHLRFEPRLHEARWLCDTLGDRLHAMIDLSDGLGLDADRLARASGADLELDAAVIPQHADCPGWRAAMSDGEDYELLFTCDPDATLPDRCPGPDADTPGPSLRWIGRVLEPRDTRAPHARVVDEKGEQRPVRHMGFEHA